ncbi:hypothetical protein ACFV4S_14705, partial [Streptomyces sp. NPDC059742]
MNDLDVLKVFCAGDGRFGNLLGVVRDGRTCPDDASRQALAAELGYSETVFGGVRQPPPGARAPHTHPPPPPTARAHGGAEAGGVVD